MSRQKFCTIFRGVEFLTGLFSQVISQNIDVPVLIRKFLKFTFQLAQENLYFDKEGGRTNLLKISTLQKRTKYTNVLPPHTSVSLASKAVSNLKNNFKP